jgi:hypothetical protein
MDGLKMCYFTTEIFKKRCKIDVLLDLALNRLQAINLSF